MNTIMGGAEVEVDVVRLDSEVIDEHLRSSTAVLHDILSDGDRSTSNSGHTCQHCGKLYKTASTLHTHYLLKHPEDKVEVQCTVCDKKYPSMLSLQKHVRYMHRYQHRCKACYRTFATTEQLEWHGEHCNETDTPCPTCGKVFSSQLALRNHLKYKHPETKSNWCGLCRRTFTSERGLANHVATIHSPGATNCGWCEREFTSVSALQSHVLYKHTVDGSRCAQCHKVFASMTSLGRHLVKVHRYIGPRYMCGVCKVSFQCSSELIRHVMHAHSDNANETTA